MAGKVGYEGPEISVQCGIPLRENFCFEAPYWAVRVFSNLYQGLTATLA